MLSHNSPGADVGDLLLKRMAGQVLLGRSDFLRLIDCPMNREEFDQKVAEAERADDGHREH